MVFDRHTNHTNIAMETWPTLKILLTQGMFSIHIVFVGKS